MCHQATGRSYDRPLHAGDIPLIAAPYLGCLGQSTITAIAGAITDYHAPQPAVLIALLEMAHRAKHDDCGMYPWPMMPFSALDLDTLERVQTDDMTVFHTVFESMALAERNMGLVNKVLSSECGCTFRFVCDCGGCIERAGEDILGSPAYAQINHLRSLAEAEGTKVIRIASFDHPEWTRRSLDMGPAEIKSYQRMSALLYSLPARESTLAMIAEPLLASLRAMSGRQKIAA
ncbi:MAG: hypothetical protein JWM39_59 [Parcubacteria group bacterium]|nr:hypothetical protein [Parcubacteria group bacterium]